MLDHATAARLREMKLNTMAEKLLWQMEQPEIQSLSFEERLGMLVDAEWTAKHARRIQRYVRRGEFRVPAVAEDVEYAGKRGISKEDFLRLCDGGYLRNKQNVILSGPSGVGKTYLACALGNSACRQCVQARYLRVPDLLFLLSAAKMDGSYMKQRKKLASVPLLILDDWGLRAFSPEDTQEMMELTELRYGRASTVIAGQLPCDKWYDLFPDPTLADAILDRLVHNAYKFNITGESMRKTLAERQFEKDNGPG
jgi:DNA replication protein DnaC